jgi:succinate-semialdehyde dehydrogenase / glutarate-semialdehyde dehydrogenase
MVLCAKSTYVLRSHTPGGHEMTSPVSNHRPAEIDSIHHDLFIGGRWQASSDGGRKAVRNPATGTELATVATATPDDVASAISAAEASFAGWASMPATERADTLHGWYELIAAEADRLATILTSEQGKPRSEARGEVLYGARFIQWFAEESKRIYGETIPTNVRGRRLFVIRQPVGVAAAITPWNFPMAMIARKVGPALAAGCTMVIKPASETPLSALAMAELASRAGIPDGVLNVVPGSGAVVGDALATSAVVRAISFTGSTEVGKELMARSAGTVKKVALELGGNAPIIVFDDADLEVAVAGTVASKFRNSGQTCVCANRILVQSGIYSDFVDRLADAVSRLQVGNGLDEGVDQGPLINEAAVEKVERHVENAMSLGAGIATGGRRHAFGGTFFEPTVLVGATPEMAIAREETFGPVAPVFRFDTEDEAIGLANDTPFGLSAYFFTRDLGRTWRVGEALEFGVVAVNTGAFSYEGAPFGGWKESGIGREGSRHGVDEFVEMKYLCIDGIGA